METLSGIGLAIAFLGSPLYILYLLDRHAPKRHYRDESWKYEMIVTKPRKYIALFFGISSLLSGLFLYPSTMAMISFGLSVPLLAYGIGGKNFLKLIPGWSKYYKNNNL